MENRVALLTFLVGIFGMTQFVFAAGYDLPIKGTEKIVIQASEAHVIVTSSAQANLRINMPDQEANNMAVMTSDQTIFIQSKTPTTKEGFGKTSGKRNVIEIQGPSVPLEIHLMDGQVTLNKWMKETLVHLQRGKVSSKDGLARLVAHVQKGDVTVAGHQGRVEVDVYQGNALIRDLGGELDLQNFSGDSTVEKSKGFLSFVTGGGTTKVSSSSGTLQFEAVKGTWISQGFQGRVEGVNKEANVSIQMSSESDVSIKSQAGRVTVKAAPGVGALLNLSAVEGEISVPSYLKVARDASGKSLRGRLRGDQPKGSITVRSQEGSIAIQ